MSPAVLGRMVLAAGAALMMVSLTVAADARGRSKSRAVAIAAAADSIALGGVDYVALDAFCDRFGLQPQSRAAAKTFVDGSKWSKPELEVDSRDNTINGLRVFFGDPVRRSRGRVWLWRDTRPLAGEVMTRFFRRRLAERDHAQRIRASKPRAARRYPGAAP